MPRTQGLQTRERILDVALDLFTEQGYDKTSLRDIAERLGITKAALYYYFERKQDILLDLHLRLHALGDEAFGELDELPDDEARIAALPRMLDRFIAGLAANRGLILFHLRNSSAIETLSTDERHIAANEDVMEKFGRLISSPAIPAEQRVRLACAIGAAIGGLFIGGRAFEDIPMPELADLVRGAVGDLFG